MDRSQGTRALQRDPDFRLRATRGWDLPRGGRPPVSSFGRGRRRAAASRLPRPWQSRASPATCAPHPPTKPST
jgi:hypothetical protein